MTVGTPGAAATGHDFADADGVGDMTYSPGQGSVREAKFHRSALVEIAAWKGWCPMVCRDFSVSDKSQENPSHT